MSKYLIEIGTEELPYSFIPSAIEQLDDLFKKYLAENKISFDDVKIYGTPRRLTAIISGLTDVQPDSKKEIKGPPAKVAFDENGALTKAGEGFLKKNNITADKIQKQTIGEIEYIVAVVEEKGQKTPEVLQNIVPEIILKLQGSHFMRWADLTMKFSRPIRWMVSLFDSEEVKITIGDVNSGKYSRGHRFHEEKNILIENPDKYVDALYAAKVIVEQDKRKEQVIKSATELAKKNNATVEFDDELVKEVTYILEWPIPVLGNFEEKYLDIPDDVTVTVMASHQRYFPLYDAKGNLMNAFITMANYLGDDLSNIKLGNERVIRARLDDAIFFYNEDTKDPLSKKVEKLKGITFQKNFGSMYEKTKRLQELSKYVANQLKLDEKTVTDVDRTALLCKADLSTSLVFEFTELQGFIGSSYAEKSGENKAVCEGIKEHYFPLSSNSELAETVTGQVVGIADKVDTICAVFASGKKPTGSADPLGVRRAVLGVLLTIINKKLDVNLTDLIVKTVDSLPVQIENKPELIEDIREFITQRLKIYLNDEYRHDLIDAVLLNKDALADLNDTMLRLSLLKGIVGKSTYSDFHEAANRILRLIKDKDYNSEPDTALFVQEVEGRLWNCVNNINCDKLSYEELIKELEKLIPTIEEFFDKVLIMDENLQIRANRISLLGNLKQRFMQVADFGKVVN